MEDVQYRPAPTKKTPREVIEIASSSDDEHEDDAPPAAAPPPPKKQKKKVSLPRCAAVSAPTNLPPRVDCCAPPQHLLPAHGHTLIQPITDASTDATMWPSGTPTPYASASRHGSSRRTGARRRDAADRGPTSQVLRRRHLRGPVGHGQGQEEGAQVRVESV